MGFVETLTIGLGSSLMKAVAKLWLKDSSIAEGLASGAVDILKKNIEDFSTRRSTQRLLDGMQDEVARRLVETIEAEFPNLHENDRIAAVEATQAILEKFDLTDEIAKSDLDSARLFGLVKTTATPILKDIGGKSAELAEFLLSESCDYIVSLAGKLPDFRIAAARELLVRSTSLQADLTKAVEAVTLLRRDVVGEKANDVRNFETSYRRAVVFKLDRLQLFGLKLVGAGTRDYALSVAYVTLTSTIATRTRTGDVDDQLPTMRRIIVRGEAGSGKTTLMQWLAVRAASRDFSEALQQWNNLTPIYIKLRDYAELPFPAPEQLIWSTTPNLVGLMPGAWAHRTLVSGAMLIADGIDEVPASRRDELLEWLTALCEDFENAVIIVSSRPAALDAERSGRPLAKKLADLHFDALSLEPMSLRDSETLVAHWHNAVGHDLSSDDDRKRLDLYSFTLRKTLRERPAIASLASNPLMCAMICALNWDRQQDLPNQRMELYKLALEMLLHGRERERKIQAAHLASLGVKAKEELLDGIAYWMLRNGYSEAPVEDVVSQVSTIAQRLSSVQANPHDITQELLERSGILRQPQHGTVDFLHRTFLEYMGARAAIKQDDLGLLVGKAQDEGWRETIVFAAGHAEGKTRDKLVSDLLKRPWFGFGSRPLEADVTTACCLETAAASLDPALLVRLQERSRALFPPKDFASAHLLAPAAALEPSLLMNHQDASELEIAACIRCASSVGGRDMLLIIASYANSQSLIIIDELFRAWPLFDSEEYVKLVVSKLSLAQALGIANLHSEPDTLRCVKFLVLRGQYVGKIDEFANAIRHFREDHFLSVDNSSDKPAAEEEKIAWNALASKRSAVDRFRYAVSLSDGERLSEIQSLKSLQLGKVERGVLAQVANLPNLESLTVGLQYPDEVNQALGRMKRLKSLTLSSLMGRDFSARDPLDLSGLSSCENLLDLELDFMGEDPNPDAISLPLQKLRRLTVAYVPLGFLQNIESATRLIQLSIQCSSIPSNKLLLKNLDQLTDVGIYDSQPEEVTFEFPKSLRSLRISRLQSFRIANLAELVNLRDLVLSGVKVVEQLPLLLGLPSLERVHVFDQQGALRAAVKAAAPSKLKLVMS